MRTRAAAGALIVALTASVLGAGCSSAGKQVSAGAGTSATAPAADCPPQNFSPVMSAVPDGPATSEPEMPPNPDPALMSVIETYGRAHADTYGGTWIDRTQPDSPITVGFTADVDTRRAELLAARAGPNDVEMITPTLPPLATTVGEAGWRVVVVEVPYSSAELSEVQSQVSAFGEADGKDLGINSVGSGSSGRPVEIGLTEVTDRARQMLGERFGDAVCVTQLGPFTPVGGSVGSMPVGSAVP